jgi:serine/threonine protein kinase/tetratricopeptide (TPR) repeat protein
MSRDLSAAGWRDAGSLFNELIDLDEPARLERLARVADSELRDAVEALLDGDATADRALPSPGFGLGALRREGLIDALAAEGFSPRTNELPGVLNGRYELGAVLGHGGMGVVYRATDRQQPDRMLAIKCIRAESMSESSLRMFKAEFKAMSEMRHPNVARVYDFERIQGSDDYLFTMELVDGENILEAARHATPEAILEYIVQVCRALSYVHSRKLIHLDLKPANIMVDRAGTVKVLDFGLVGARAREGPASFFGTPAYVAPEMLNADRALDHRADLYSLGITWYELLCHRLPFSSSNVLELLKLHQTAPLRFDDVASAHVPVWMRRIVERLCAKHAADRFRSGNAVIEAINAAGSKLFEVETSATRDSYFFAGRLVGRQEQLDALSRFMNERLSDDTAPREPVFVLAGPSGSGKSRLMLELRHRAQMAHTVFIEADCYEGSASDYEPIVTAVGYLVRLAESIAATDLLDRFAPTLALLDPRFDRGHALSVAGLDHPDAARVAMIAQIGEFMVAVAERLPYVLYINDLQWARVGTLDMLLNLSRLIAVRERGGSRARLAVLGSYRDDEVDGRPIEPWLRALRDHHEIRSVRVEPLSRREVAALLCSMLGIDELPDGFVERITRETAGNPFFIGEAMRSLVERGSVYLESGRWCADRPIGVLEIPATMAILFERRLAQLDDRERDVLQLIAAYGRPMPLSLIATVANLDDEGVHQIMLGLLRRQMISRGVIDGQACAWPLHDRIRELAYAQTNRGTRLRLHRALAEALEARVEREPNAPLDEVARQWWAAEDRDKALDFCVRGGQQAKRRHALETAIELFDNALSLLPSEDASPRTSVEKDLAEVLALAGDFDRATAMYDRLLPRLGTTLERARVLKELGSIAYHRGNTPLALDNIWKALVLLGERRPRGQSAQLVALALAAGKHFVLRFLPFLSRPAKDRAKMAAKADCYLALVYPDYFTDQREVALAVLRGANIAAGLGEGPHLSLAYSYLAFGFYASALSRFTTASEFSRRALVMADAFALPLHRAHAYEAAMFVHFLTGDWEAGSEAALNASALFRAHGDMSCVGSSYCLLLLNYQARGMLRAARGAAQEGLEIIERVGAISVSTPVSMKHGMLLVDLGHDGLPKIHEAFQTAERMGDPLQRAWVRLLLGHCYFTLGQLEEAIGYLESCVDLRRRFHLDSDFLSPSAHSLLARAYVETARQTPDPRVRRQLLRRANRQAAVAMRSMKRRSSYRASALLATAQCRWEDGREREALALFDESIAVAERQGSRLMMADAHFELGQRLRDVADARRHLQIALDVYDACEAAPRIQCARRALDKIA